MSMSINPTAKPGIPRRHMQTPQQRAYGDVMRQIQKTRELDEVDEYSRVTFEFDHLGFTSGEVKAFMAQQPAVYTKALKAMMDNGMTRDMVVCARDLNRLKSYRLARLEKFLAPLGEFAIQFLKDNLKGKSHVQ